MSIGVRIVLSLISIVFLGFVLLLVTRGKLLLKYSLMWLFLGLAMFFCAVFPGAVSYLAQLTGFITSANFVFLIAIAVLLAIALSLSVVVSRLLISIKNLTQRIALLESAGTRSFNGTMDANHGVSNYK